VVKLLDSIIFLNQLQGVRVDSFAFDLDCSEPMTTTKLLQLILLHAGVFSPPDGPNSYMSGLRVL